MISGLAESASAKPDRRSRLVADAGVFGPKGQAGFARSADWRAEADRILAHLSKAKTT